MRFQLCFVIIAMMAVSCKSTHDIASHSRDFPVSISGLDRVSRLSASFIQDGNLDMYVDREYLDSCVFELPQDLADNEIAKRVAAKANMAFFVRFLTSAEELGVRIMDQCGEWYSEVEPMRKVLPKLFDDEQILKMAYQVLDMLKDGKIQEMESVFQPIYDSYSEKHSFISDEELENVQDQFWTLYDKKKYVADIDSIQQNRKDGPWRGIDSLSLDNLRHRRMTSKSLDEYSIVALEENFYADYRDTTYINILGGIIESREYTPYLAEVYFNWRPLVQDNFFGASKDSVIPNIYYDTVRNICLHTILRHICENPEDLLAKALADNLICQQPLRRFGWQYGNEVMISKLNNFRTNFLPDSF